MMEADAGNCEGIDGNGNHCDIYIYIYINYFKRQKTTVIVNINCEMSDKFKYYASARYDIKKKILHEFA